MLSTADKVVDTFTLGQLNSLTKLFNQYSGTYQVGLVAKASAVLLVVVKLVVPAIIAFIVVGKLANRVLGLIASVATLFFYSIFYANPLTLYSQVSDGVAKFISYLSALPSITYDSFIIKGLTYGPVVFGLKLLISFAGVWILIIAIMILFTVVMFFLSLGRNVWSITERSGKALTLLMALTFMLLYPVFGSFKALVSVFTIVLGGINITEGFYTLRGRQKQCFQVGEGKVKCYWK